MNTEKHFPNGFKSWRETFYHAVEAIESKFRVSSNISGLVGERHRQFGSAGMYDLAEELADEFETIHVGNDWHEDDFIDTIGSFLFEKLD